MKNKPYSQRNNAYWYVVVDKYDNHKAIPEGTILQRLVDVIGGPITYSEARALAFKLNQISEVMRS